MQEERENKMATIILCHIIVVIVVVVVVVGETLCSLSKFKSPSSEKLTWLGAIVLYVDRAWSFFKKWAIPGLYFSLFTAFQYSWQ